MKRSAVGLVGLLVLLTLPGRAAPAVLVLASGGRIEGELLNPSEEPRQTYVVKLVSGGQISLSAAQVKQVIEVKPELTEYEKVRRQYPDTVEGQWQLAEWCKEHELEAQRKIHLERVIVLDPEHVPARRALNYAKHLGQWFTYEEWKRKQGFVPYKGEWKLPQEIELLEGKRKKELAEKEWIAKVSQWRGWLGGTRSKQARDNLLAITDPMAVKALAMYLRKEANPDIRLLYVEALGKVNGPESDATLAVTAMEDGVEEVRLSALDVLQTHQSPASVAYFVGKLRDRDNVTVKRAALALGRMKDPSAVVPLINALITVHKYKVGGGGNPGQMSMSFPTGKTPGGPGLSMNQQPKIVLNPVQNQEVLDALATITGQNFSFDQRAWKTWFAGQNTTQAIDARRN